MSAGAAAAANTTRPTDAEIAAARFEPEKKSNIPALVNFVALAILIAGAVLYHRGSNYGLSVGLMVSGSVIIVALVIINKNTPKPPLSPALKEKVLQDLENGAFLLLRFAFPKLPLPDGYMKKTPSAALTEYMAFLKESEIIKNLKRIPEELNAEVEARIQKRDGCADITKKTLNDALKILMEFERNKDRLGRLASEQVTQQNASLGLALADSLRLIESQVPKRMVEIFHEERAAAAGNAV